MKHIATILAEQKLDGLFLVDPSNIRYLSGYSGEAAFLLQLHDQGYLITDYRYTEQAEEECLNHRVITIDREKESVEQRVAKIARQYGLTRIGFEKKHLSCERYGTLQETLRQNHRAELVATGGLVEALRYQKNTEEIDAIRKAAEIADHAFTKILPLLRPGISEKEAALQLEMEIRRGGAEDISFPIILVGGVNGSRPHGVPSQRLLEKGELVTLDFGAKYKGYRSDITRTVAIGHPDEKQREMYNIVKEAQQTGVDAVRAGVPGVEVDLKVRTVLQKYGCLEQAGKGLGHGVGLDIHEKPFLNEKCEEILQSGCVITIEPGIYIPSWGGIRIEDTIAVTEEGGEILTKSTKELLILE